MFSLVAWIAAAYAQSCGDTLSTPNAVVTLTADIVCPPGHTGQILRINADNVTIDGNGFRLVGAGVGTTSNGVLVNARDDATIQNLIIEGATKGQRRKVNLNRPVPKAKKGGKAKAEKKKGKPEKTLFD